MIRADGGSRSWINGRSVTLSQLTELAALLVEIHGQHEHQALLSRPSQLALLDAYGRNDSERARSAQCRGRWSALLRERDSPVAGRATCPTASTTWSTSSMNSSAKTSPLRAIEALSANHRRQANASGLIDACNAAFARLAGDESPSVSRQLQQTRSELARMAEHEPRLHDVDALLENANIQLDEALVVLDRVRDDLDADPAQFMELERKLTRIHDLARKHRVTPAQLAEQRDASPRNWMACAAPASACSA